MKNFFNKLNFSSGVLKIKNWWKGFWQNKDITKKFLWTLLLLSIYLVMTTIKAPFVKIKSSERIEEDVFFNTLNLVGGGGLKNFSLVALGISPFINASLIMSLLQTSAFPAIQKLGQSGPQGRRKLNVITRILTLFISVPQAILLTKSLSIGQNGFISIVPVNGESTLNVTQYFLLPMILIGGSLFSLFLAEQITDRGIGNGTSLIIFVGIAFGLPAQFKGAFSYFVGTENNTTLFIGSLKLLTYIFVYATVIFIIGLIYNSERHIPIQQIGAGRSRNIKEMGKLPIKLNPGGIMPIIFATMLISFPLMIARILPPGNDGKLWIEANMNFTQPIGLSLLVLVTFFFSFIMGIQQSRVDKISEDFAKSSTFIPGIQPGEQTEDYLVSIVIRLSIFSGFYLVILVSFNYLQTILLDFPPIIAFGGTGMMILVSVSIETIQQFQARRKSMKLSKRKSISRKISDNISYEKSFGEFGEFANEDKSNKKTSIKKNEDGLLW
ncbi:preprotein translocase subunit SecY [Mycoplasma sp. Mirounga ES2805-ORL]|uniref:preprotein translocase subunit SecY n=1 Tax=Mycoplasma sp. Mirounga ES2805-ORL TaxID=754514 RepID=UPI00197BAB73|nr:preprotein translocase subunit SecY [Mycoplasma sp. Mirounga ES2805-ORL]QSF13903.1 preprotein translocase subunit SecY [Mycoplasma sp. Mirounga ES2805-ORL]